MITRDDYMKGKVTFKEYYTSVAKHAGLNMKNSAIMPRVKAALENGDEHLNSITLATWDSMGANVWVRNSLYKSFKAHNDYMTLAGIVCVLKQSCINVVRGE